MRILRAAGHRRMPWKNGGGETLEVAVFPEDAGLDDFDWRISMARIDGDGPFSAFPGIDRTLAILEGAGILLGVEGEDPRRLTIESAPHVFRADLPASARLIGGSVIDFNVMSRRGKVTHEVRPLVGAIPVESDSIRLILSTTSHLAIDTEGRSTILGRYDALLLGSGEEMRLARPTGVSGFLVTLKTKN